MDIEWEGVAVMDAIAEYQNGLIDFMMVDSKFTTGMVEAGLYRLPMMGSALVMVYNLPSLNTQLVPLTTTLGGTCGRVRTDRVTTQSRAPRQLFVFHIYLFFIFLFSDFRLIYYLLLISFWASTAGAGWRDSGAHLVRQHIAVRDSRPHSQDAQRLAADY